MPGIPSWQRGGRRTKLASRPCRSDFGHGARSPGSLERTAWSRHRQRARPRARRVTFFHQSFRARHWPGRLGRHPRGRPGRLPQPREVLARAPGPVHCSGFRLQERDLAERRRHPVGRDQGGRSAPDRELDRAAFRGTRRGSPGRDPPSPGDLHRGSRNLGVALLHRGAATLRGHRPRGWLRERFHRASRRGLLGSRPAGGFARLFVFGSRAGYSRGSVSRSRCDCNGETDASPGWP